jgi:branched-chain amino acid transport system permease protein
LAVLIENALLYAFHADTRTVDLPYAFRSIDLGFTFLALPRVVSFAAVFVVALLLWAIMALTDTGKAIRAVASEKLGAELAGIDVAHIYAVTFGLGTACVAIAACLLVPTYYVTPRAGEAFVLVAFTIVVLGGMGSVPGALIGGLLIGIVESLAGFFLGESLGQVGIFLIFIVVLLVRPRGLFGASA